MGEPGGAAEAGDRCDMKGPTVDLGMCTMCLGCVEVCPEVFRVNDAGYVEVVEADAYDEACVADAIKYCPEDCISWEED